MPRRPLRPCNEPGCGALVPRGRCAKHARKPYANRRPHTDSGWARQQWAKAIIARDPICVICGKRPSTEADHIKPESEGGRATMDNGRGTCRPCNVKLMTERRKR